MINPFAPAFETVEATDESEAVDRRHPARVPLRIVGFLYAIPVLVFAAPFPIYSLRLSIAAMLVSVIAFFLAFAPYGSISRALTIMLAGVMTGLLLVVILIGFLSSFSLFPLAFFAWIGAVTLREEPPKNGKNQLPESPEDSNVNPFAPTSETVESEPVRSDRHPAKWPLLVAGALLLVPVVLTLVSSASRESVNTIQLGTVLFLAAVAIPSLFLGFLPYSATSRSLSIILGGLISGMIGVLMLFGALSIVSLGILLLYLWVFIASIVRSPNTVQTPSGNRSRV